MDRRRRVHRRAAQCRAPAGRGRRMLDRAVRAGFHAEYRQRRQRAHGGSTGAGLTSKSNMDLIVYSAAWCPDCREAKRFLAKHNIPYKDIDVETTPDAMDEVVKH